MRVPGASALCCAPLKWKNNRVQQPLPSSSSTCNCRRPPLRTSALRTVPSSCSVCPGCAWAKGVMRVWSS